MSAPRSRSGAGTRAALLWPLGAAVTVIVGGLVPLIRGGSRYYFVGDTQIAYMGWMYRLGEHVRDGRWPILDVQSWEAGNYSVEGQMGLFSPLSMLMGIGLTYVTNVVVFFTIVKIALLVVAAMGTYVLVGSYGVARSGRFVAAVAVPLGGATQWLESPTWINGQVATTLLPWAWWAMRRCTRGASPVPPLLLGGLMVTIGFVYGTIYLIFVLVGCLVEALLARSWRGVLCTTGVGIFAGLLAVTVYLPGVLASPVTMRAGWQVLSEGQLRPDLYGAVGSMLPMVISPSAGSRPYQYVVWFLPLLAWIDPTRLRASARSCADAIVVLALFLAFVLGPGQIGQLRWPMRNMPSLTVVAVVVLVVLLWGTIRVAPSRGRLVASLVLVAVSGYLVTARVLHEWETQALGIALTSAGVLLAWGVARRQSDPNDEVWTPSSSAWFAATLATWCLVILVLQHQVFPTPSEHDKNMPAAVSDYQVQQPAAQGDVMVVGTRQPALIQDASVADEHLLGSAWYLNPRVVRNSDTSLQFRRYTQKFCTRYNGDTCPDALRRLLAQEPTTREPWVDLMAISTLVLFKPYFPSSVRPPEGWHLADEGRWSWTWVRDRPVPTAGGVVWADRGVRLSGATWDDTKLQFRVDDLPADGGDVVLSRLAWPGYEVKGASLREPLEGILLRVHLPKSAEGRIVSLRYAPPGWRLERFTLVLALLLGGGWSVAHTTGWLRRRVNRREGRTLRLRRQVDRPEREPVPRLP